MATVSGRRQSEQKRQRRAVLVESLASIPRAPASISCARRFFFLLSPLIFALCNLIIGEKESEDGSLCTAQSLRRTQLSGCLESSILNSRCFRQCRDGRRRTAKWQSVAFSPLIEVGVDFNLRARLIELFTAGGRRGSGSRKKLRKLNEFFSLEKKERKMDLIKSTARGLALPTTKY